MQPLSGVRVIEFCAVAAGPYCAMLLADMGADVIKVENPREGDALRQWPPITEGFSENFASLNRNKRSVALDLKNATDNLHARELILGADVVIESNRPGVMKRLGLDFDSVKDDRHGLIYCSISAFGQEGPRSQEAGFDLTIQAMSGIMSVTGEPDSGPVKCGVPVSDFATGLYGAFAISSALHEVRRTGESVHVDVSMLGASLAISALQTSQYFGSGRDPERLGSVHPRNAPYQAFRCKDGYFAMAAGNDKLFHSACSAIGQPDIAEDERFATTALRAQNQRVLLGVLEHEFAQQTAGDLLLRFRAAGVPCAPINSYSVALADEQVTHAGWVQPLNLPSGVTTRTFASPIRLGDETAPIYRNPPRLGEHNDEVLKPMKVAVGQNDG